MTNQSSLFCSRYQIAVLKNKIKHTPPKKNGVCVYEKHLFFLLRRKSLFWIVDYLEAVNVSPTGKQRVAMAHGPR